MQFLVNPVFPTGLTTKGIFVTSRPSVFIANTDNVLAEGHIEGDLAAKVMHVSPRFGHYPYRHVVVPGPVSAAFIAYAASLGAIAKIYTPKGLNPERLSIMDAFSDPGLLELIRGADVYSYMSTTALYAAVTAAGGHYVGGNPTASALANSKAYYVKMARGVVATPPNCAILTGISAIAAEVHDRLVVGRDVFVRLDNSGGGFGNRVFLSGDWPFPSHHEIVKVLEGSDPASWHGGTALVEDCVDLAYSPGVAFHTDFGLWYDFVQITRGRKDNVGRWTPVPEWIADGDELERVGDYFAAQLRALGYHGNADTDLGITADGTLYGFETNGRSSGSRDTIEIVERLHGPWRTWRARGIAVKSVTDFHLSGGMSFEHLVATLEAEGLLATRSNPWGAVILIPPVDTVAGIAVIGHGYEEAETVYRRVDQLVGNQELNTEDAPLFASVA